MGILTKGQSREQIQQHSIGSSRLVSKDFKIFFIEGFHDYNARWIWAQKSHETCSK